VAHTADSEVSISAARFRRDEAFVYLQQRAEGAAKFKLLSLAFSGVRPLRGCGTIPKVGPTMRNKLWSRRDLEIMTPQCISAS